ncbi:FAH [Lepeophtheirus salmonis]|uniref:Fumarylacetoacetase n=1 Tax=Lepeophtheirus salmonis TaxID=72036 RepID=A0A7R8H435_LEPSM|nr:FAH [Lepeophtheirus salmonis]CAF2843798.1 FAH [Lepeophtheirus salmonis]
MGRTGSTGVVTSETMTHYLTPNGFQGTGLLSYHRESDSFNFCIKMQISVKLEGASKEDVVTKPNFKYIYWAMKLQLTYNPATGSYGSMLQLYLKGSTTIKLERSGEERKFIRDGDVVNVSGFCQGNGYRATASEKFFQLTNSK